MLTRRNVGARLYSYYLTREAFLIARMVVEIEGVLGAASGPRIQRSDDGGGIVEIS